MLSLAGEEEHCLTEKLEAGLAVGGGYGKRVPSNGPTALRGNGGHPNFTEGLTLAPGVGSVGRLLCFNGRIGFESILLGRVYGSVMEST